MLIFSEKISNRLLYTFEFIFNDYLNIEFELTDNKDKFLNYQGIRICYGNKPIGKTFFIFSEKLLFETGIYPMDVLVQEIDGIKVLFPSTHTGISFPFDIFSAVFYQLSRYEEYLFQFKKNQYRFPANESLAYRYHFLNIPVVHVWIEMLAQAIEKEFPEFEYNVPKFSFFPTFDVDNAYAYKFKGFLRTVGATVKSALLFRIQDYFDRWLTLFGIQKDKYDSYEYIEQIINEKELKPVWFFLLGNYGRFDKNISFKNVEFRELILHISKNFPIGIHPSFSSNDKEEQLSTEIRRLEQIIGKKVNQSRQHFLRMKLSETYNKLIDTGIMEDYSMGYAEETGYRAGVAIPFFFFDLEQNDKTNLKIIPFQMMDITLRNYKQYDSEKSKEIIKSLIDITKKYHGTFVSLWHNESLGTDKYWKNWRSVFEFMVSYGKDNEN